MRGLCRVITVFDAAFNFANPLQTGMQHRWVAAAIGRPELTGNVFKIDFYDMAFAQILWTQNEVRRLPRQSRPPA